MKQKILLLFFFALALTSKSQSIFSTLHLNEERDVHRGTPRIITESKTFYNSNGTETKKELIEYDRLGLPISKKFIEETGKVTSMITYKYDTIRRIILESNITEFNVRFPTNKVRTVYQYERDLKTPDKILHLDSKGVILTEVVLENNSSGLPVQLQFFEPLGNLVGIETAFYIPKENKAIVSVANSEGHIFSTDTMKISFKDAYKYFDANIRYNENGDVIFSESVWPNGTVHYREYEYVYDKSGNWREQKSFEVIYKSNGKKRRSLESYFKREIVYWKE